MLLLDCLTRLLSRFRYPVSLPEDIAADLGLLLTSKLSFEELIAELSIPHLSPRTLWKWMPRSLADGAFQSAFKKERFPSCSLFSYYFNEGWLVMTLHFDEGSFLRRLTVQCPGSKTVDGFDIILKERVLLSSLKSLQSPCKGV